MKVKFNPFQTKSDRLSLVQQQVLVHTQLYMENRKVLSEPSYRELVAQLYNMYAASTDRQKERSRYWYACKEEDGVIELDKIVGRLLRVDRAHIGTLANVTRRRFMEKHGGES